MKEKIRKASVVLLMLLGACGTQVPVNNLQPAVPQKGPPDYYFDNKYHDVMEFEQGIMHQYNLIEPSHVSRGEPILTVKNLPETAEFDGKTLSWKPACGPDPEFYLRGYGLHYIILELKSSVDDEQFIQRRAALMVHEFKEFEDLKCEMQQ